MNRTKTPRRVAILRPLDIVSLVGAAVSILVGIYSCISGFSVLYGVTSIASAFLFPLLLVYYRRRHLLYDFVSFGGVCVRVGIANKPLHAQTRGWIAETVAWWTRRYGLAQVLGTCRGRLLVFTDDCVVQKYSIVNYLRGYVVGDVAQVSFSQTEHAGRPCWAGIRRNCIRALSDLIVARIAGGNSVERKALCEACGLEELLWKKHLR